MTDIEMIQTRMNGFDNKMTGLENKVQGIGTTVSHMNKTIDSIDAFLRGNGFDKTDQGLIGEHNQLKEEVKELKKFKDRAIWFLVGAGVIGGLNLVQVIDAVRKAFSH